MEVEIKKESLLRELNSLEQLGLMANAITLRQFESQQKYQREIAELEDEIERIMADDTLTEEEKAARIRELEEKMAGLKERHEKSLTAFERERTVSKLFIFFTKVFLITLHILPSQSLEEATRKSLGDIDVGLRDMEMQRHQLMEELERQKLNATPSQLIDINKKIAALERRQHANGKKFSSLNIKLIIN